MPSRALITVAVSLLVAAIASPASAATSTSLISVSGTGGPTNGISHEPVLSADGRFVAFTSNASDIVPGDINGFEVFVRDLMSGTPKRVAVDATGNQATRASMRPEMSADGRFVAFESIAPNLVPGDTNARVDIFVK